VADVPGLYFVSEQQLVNVTGGSVAARKALEAILGKNEIALAVFLDGLGIDGLGTSTSNEVAKTFKTLDCVLSATAPEFDALPDIGPLTAEKIVKGLSDMLDMIARMRQVIDIIDVREKVGPLKGMSFVLTGAMSKPRKTIEAAIEAAGGENKGSVSKGVTYLVQADASSTSSKTEKANKVGTKIISEVKLWEMMG
jgi:DNA ligase (NAD+)